MAEAGAITVRFGVSLDGLSAGLGRATDQIKSASEQMKAQLGAIDGMFGKLNGALAGLAAVGAGMAFFKSAVNETVALNGEAMKLAKSLGVTTNEAGALAIALGDVGLDAETMTNASTMLSRQLRTNEDALSHMGVTTRDASGQLLSMHAVMDNALGRLRQYKDGTDQLLAAQAVFGRGAADAIKLLKVTAEVTEEAKRKQEELGLTLTEQGQKDVKAYKAAMNDVGDVLTAVKKVVGEAVMPAFTMLAQYFSEIGPAAVTVFKGAIGGIMTVFWGLKNGLVVVFEMMKAAIYQVAEPILGLIEATSLAMQGKWSEAGDRLSLVWDNMKARGKMAFDAIAASSEETAKRVASLFMPGEAAGKPKGTGGGEDYKAPKEKGNPDSIMAQLEKQLAARKNSYEAENALRQFSKDQEAAYWNEVVSVAGGNATVRDKIERKALEATIAARRQAAAQGVAMTETEVNRLAEIRQAAAEEERAAQDQSLALSIVSDTARAERSLAIQRQYEDKSYEVKREAIMQRIALAELDPDHPTKRAELYAQLDALQAQHAAQQKQMAVQEAGQAMEPWRAAQMSMQSLFEQGMTGLMNGTLKFKDAMRKVWGEMLKIFVNEFITKKISAWLAAEVVQTGATVVGVGARTAAEETGALQILAIKAAMTLKSIAMAAWDAAASVYKAIAGIPYVGPFLAPAMAIGAVGAVMAFGSHIASASGGYDIPTGVNPLVQAHAQEMILPARYANVIRGMADQGGAVTGGGGQMNVTINAVDSKSVKQLFADNAPAMADALKKHARNFGA